MPASTNRCDTAKPQTPASVTWASDTWPTNPVITTSDRHTTTPIEREHQRLPVAERAARSAARRRPPPSTTVGARQPLRSGGRREALLDQLAARRQARAAQRQRERRAAAKMSSAWTPGSGLPRCRSGTTTASRRSTSATGRSRCRSRPGRRSPSDVNRGEQRGGQRRHDEQRQGGRVGLRERSGDDAHGAGRWPTPSPCWPSRAGSATGRPASRTTSFSAAARVARPKRVHRYKRGERRAR